MSETELLAYFESDKLQSGDLNSLGYVLDGFLELTDSLKELVSTIVNKNNNRYSGKLSLDDVFATGNDIECYYWVCRFLNDRGVGSRSLLIRKRLSKHMRSTPKWHLRIFSNYFRPIWK
ncbi:hypothetical protein H9W95_18370 [Flavobacterium lindanitolerans]|nr:hypothetical protein [Flavobacterium lindanitolerans]